MSSFCFPACWRRQIAARLLLACSLAAIAAAPLAAQSTFGSILGTVRDFSGALVVGARVTLINSGTASTRTIQTDNSGGYAFLNLDAESYALTIAGPGFEN